MKKIIFLSLAFLITSVSLRAQDKAGKRDTTQHVVLYSFACPMHPNFISDKPGKCPKCGMDLTQLSPKEQFKRDVTKLYTCPVHAEILSTEAGKCPRCGKDLTLSPKERMKAEVTQLSYYCRMHPDQTSNTPAKCPKCGMEMLEKKSKQ